MFVQGGVDEMKSGRVVVSAQVEPMSDIWYYQDGLLKNKVMLSSWQLLRNDHCTLGRLIMGHVCVAADLNHEPAGDGQRRARIQGDSVVGDPSAHPDVDHPDKRPHQQCYVPWHGAGCERYQTWPPTAQRLSASYKSKTISFIWALQAAKHTTRTMW